MRQRWKGGRTLVLLSACVIALALAGTAYGFGQFRDLDPYPTGGLIYGVATGDVTGDGRVDILAGNDDGDDHISLLRGKGDGSFKDEERIEDPDGPEGIAIGRFNSDRRPDFAVADYGDGDDDSKVAIYLGASGGFDPGQVLDAGPGVWLVQAADLDRDGRLDLVAGNYDPTAGEAISVFLGKRRGKFRPAHTYQVATGGAYGLDVARMNRDPRPDVVVVTADGSVSVLTAKPDGSLAGAKTVPDATSSPGYNGVAVADFDRDGRNDAVVTDYEQDALVVMEGKGTGKLGSPKVRTPPTLANLGPWPIEAANLTGDRRPDLAVGTYDTPELHVFRTRASGNFQQVDGHALESIPEVIAAGKLNGDAAADLAVGTDAAVEVFINKKQPQL
jgi:hypothetical protein